MLMKIDDTQFLFSCDKQRDVLPPNLQSDIPYILFDSHFNVEF